LFRVLSAEAADLLGLHENTPITYRAGDQPNNAFSLSVLNPGEIAATAGTSGVVYGVIDTPSYDPLSRVNTFVHVNHTPEKKRFGVLLLFSYALDKSIGKNNDHQYFEQHDFDFVESI
jgi:xylulokinase